MHMKKTLKKTLAVILVLSVLIPCSAVALRVKAKDADAVTIYVRGVTDIYKYNEDGSKEALYDDGEYVDAIIDDAAPLLLTGKYDAYAEKVLEIVTPAYEAFRPSLEDGSVPANTHPEFVWDADDIDPDAPYYEYFLDERLSPFVVAEDLHNYIEAVKAETGKTKIYLYARCLGPVAALTYLYVYERPLNYENVAGVMLSFSTHESMSLADAVFTGSVYVSSKALTRWLASTDLTEMDVDAGTAQMIQRLLNALNTVQGLSLTSSLLNRLYSNLKYNLFKPLLKEYYALRLMDMACVNEKFDDMIAYLFSDEGDEETYAYALGELRNYHENVYPAINGMLQTIKEQGKNVIIMADYGGQQYPVSKESEYLGDYQVGTKAQSIGATTSKVDETLSKSYIAERKEAGFEAYISPDKKVDASTCLFPDNTFFVANLDHVWSSDYTHAELSMLYTDEFDVHSDPELPQFLYWDEENAKLVPLSSVQTDQNDENDFLAFLRKIVDFFKRIIQAIVNIFK